MLTRTLFNSQWGGHQYVLQAPNYLPLVGEDNWTGKNVSGTRSNLHRVVCLICRCPFYNLNGQGGGDPYMQPAPYYHPAVGRDSGKAVIVSMQ